jgi:hypothetical protein
MEYLGHLSVDDPFYSFLKNEILAGLHLHREDADFRVYRLHASNRVFLYVERHTRKRFIGKFFYGMEGRTWESADKLMVREFENLIALRKLGFDKYPHYVVKPYAINAGLGCVLVEEFSKSQPLETFFAGAVHFGKKKTLYEKLTALASFLAHLHNKTASDYRVDFEQECVYFCRLMRKLESLKQLNWGEAEHHYHLMGRWRERGFMYEDVQVTVHGDLTPSNLLFGKGESVVAIDLERMKTSDRVFDLGRLVGEIKHYFMLHKNNGAAAEPFIGHFLWEYCGHFPHRHRAFESITRRIPFYLGMTLLRIARNSWVTPSYRRQLLEEASRNLQ